MLKNAREEEQVELIKLVEEVWDAGIVVVAAAGNNGPAGNSVTIPGICRTIITVGSSDDDNRQAQGQGLRKRSDRQLCHKTRNISSGNKNYKL